MSSRWRLTVVASDRKGWANSRLVLFADLRPDATCMRRSEWTADHGAEREVVAIAVTTGFWLDFVSGNPDHAAQLARRFGQEHLLAE